MNKYIGSVSAKKNVYKIKKQILKEKKRSLLLHCVNANINVLF